VKGYPHPCLRTPAPKWRKILNLRYVVVYTFLLFFLAFSYCILAIGWLYWRVKSILTH